MNEQLGVVSIEMVFNSSIFLNDLTKRCSVKRKQKRAKDRTLWDSETKLKWQLAMQDHKQNKKSLRDYYNCPQLLGGMVLKL